MLEPFLQLFRGYAWYEIAVEMAVIWICVYAVYRSLRGTRGAGVIKGVALVLVVLTLIIRVLGGSTEAFGRIRFISSELLGLLAIILAVVFQPELRQAMIRVGQTRFFNRQTGEARQLAAIVAEAVEYLAKSRFGALIVIERQTGLGGLVEEGVELDAKLSSELLRTIFYPNSALHDLAVVIRGDRVLAAGVQLPLPEGGERLPSNLGSRHRAAQGLSLDSDALVVVVSEETGHVRIAERGHLSEPIPLASIEEELRGRLQADRSLATRVASGVAGVRSAAERTEGSARTVA